ncbi:SpoIIE family protein phosphatase [Streptomyces indicus]|uniref:SpoIIE family protein phosphatase n=1 Tax=Streptomyces indicus TaxID=417292 RepID=UPI0015A4D1DC|nr:SpoIIE family protein phosphatase [Streptomyces indicus]
MPTPYGIRILMADLPGKSDATRAVAEELLERWRRQSLTEPSLTDLAVRLDAALAPHLDAYAKVLLMNAADDGSRVEFICCGHQPPYVVADGRITAIEPLTMLPPLGLFSLAPSVTRIYVTSVGMGPKRRMLALTDGVTEAVGNQGAGFAVTEDAVALGDRESAGLVAQLAEKFDEHRRDSDRGEATLLLLEQNVQRDDSDSAGVEVPGNAAA